MTTIAKAIENAFWELEADERGFRPYEQVDLLVLEAHNNAMSRVYDSCQSVDSSVKYEFEDGSYLRIENPKQHSFPARFSAHHILDGRI